MSDTVSASTINRCWRCRAFARSVTDGWDLTDIQKELLTIIHGGHDAC